MGKEPENTAGRGYLRIAVQLLVISIFVLLIVYFMRKYASDLSNLQHLSLRDFLIIGVWSLASYTAYAYAVYVVLVDLGLKGLSPIAWLGVYFASRLANLFVVQGGNIFRLVYLKKKHNFSYTNSIGVTGFLIWLNAIIALSTTTYFLVSFDRSYFIEDVSLLTWCAYILLVLIVLPFIAGSAGYLIKKSSVGQSRVAVPLVEISEFFTATVSNHYLFLRLALLSAVHFFLFIGVNYFSFRAIGEPVSVATACVFTSFFVFTRYINVVPGNLGVSELVGGLVSEQIGVGFGNGLLVTTIVRMTEVALVLFLGLVFGKSIANNLLRFR